MKSYKRTKEIIYMIIAFIMITMCVFNSVYATEATPKPGVSSPPSEGSSNLPHIEMKVKAVTLGDTNQIRIECWGSKFTKLEGLDIAFTYNNEKLTPSNISTNEVIDNLESIKYDKAPTQSDLQQKFNERSTQILSKSFQFSNEYENILGINTFKFLAPDGNKEAMQFMIIKTDFSQDVNAEEEILLGTFSFKQTEGTTIDENDFSTKKIRIYCDDGLNDDDYSYYTKEEANGDDCTEIVEFTFEKYGSISGKIKTAYYNEGEYQNIGENIASIKLYKASDVEDIDWTITGSDYQNNRLKIQPIIEGEYQLCYRPDKNQTPEIKPAMEISTEKGQNGEFKLDNILFDKYVVVIDKLNYADYIITDVVIDGNNKDIDLGEIELHAGDLNKDGIINKTDRTIFLRLFANAESFKDEFGFVAFDLNDDENQVKSSDKTDRTFMLRILDGLLNETVKEVVSLSEKV